ncbi:transcriptional regulator, DeoR family [Albimonas donghaensis]|uniref:Transcriptional regulator, DeoR family n=1 Tax=Albimonas donghaensis TaxID=356660 RepID=A0A1H3AWR2_9RHOB|nr:DeoR/GlpR family DNA-binding transcription regulator [Albimonas donghaensis]SDX34152.1 transcriptional regulator, DeoR family [Albimonas donghaensis]
MAQIFRHPEILEIARQEGRVTVEDLAARFGVTVQTIRRDLADLAEAGRLARVHGGAVLPSGVSNIGYEDRRALNLEAKAAIGRACARDLPDGASVFLSIGTTTEAVARELLRHRNLMVVTNNLNIAHILAGAADCQVVVTGGRLRPADGGMVGDLAAASIERFRFDIAVIGCSALDAGGDLLDFDLAEVAASRMIVAQSRQVRLVADHTKFHRRAPVRIASLAQLDAFYTDRAPAPEVAERCRDWGTELRICG